MKRLFKLVIFFLLLGAICFGLYELITPHHAKQKPKAPILVQLKRATLTEYQPNIVSSGFLRSLNSATIRTKVSGYLMQIYVHNGEYVKKGEVLASISTPETQNALKANAIAAHVAASIYQKNSSLPSGYIAKQLLAEQQSSLAKANATYQNSLLAQHNELLHAPFTGTLGERLVNIGDYLSTGGAFINITNNKTLIASYALPAQDSYQLHLGEKVSLTLPGYNTEKLIGKITYISPSINQSTQTIDLEARIPNQHSILKPGAYVLITTPLGQPEKHLLIPNIAVLGSSAGFYIYQMKAGLAIKTPITISGTYYGKKIITSGLAPGSSYLIKGQHIVEDGSKIQAINPESAQ